MTTGTLHQLTPDLYLIEGGPTGDPRHPSSPTVAVYRAGRRLFLLDTGIGLEQRQGIRTAAHRLLAVTPSAELVLLNTHSSRHRTGNNDLLHELHAARRAQVPADESSLDSEIQIGDTQWRGLTFRGDDGRRDLQVLRSGVTQVGSVVFYLPGPRVLLLGDEVAPHTSNLRDRHEHLCATLRRALGMFDTGELDTVCGEVPGMTTGMRGDQARAALVGVIGSRA